MSSEKRYLPFISSAKAPDEVDANREFVVSITGNWPTPSWELDRLEVETAEEDHVIEVRYVGKNQPGMAMQVLQPFSADLRLTVPSAGTWEVKVHGKSAVHRLEVNAS